MALSIFLDATQRGSQTRLRDRDWVGASASRLPFFDFQARLLQGGGCGTNRRLNFPPQQEVQSFLTLSTESTGTNVIIIHYAVFFVYYLKVVFSFNI